MFVCYVRMYFRLLFLLKKQNEEEENEKLKKEINNKFNTCYDIGF